MLLDPSEEMQLQVDKRFGAPVITTLGTTDTLPGKLVHPLGHASHGPSQTLRHGTHGAISNHEDLPPLKVMNVMDAVARSVEKMR